MTSTQPANPVRPDQGPQPSAAPVYASARPNDNMAIVSLVIALVSLFGGVTFLGVPGVIGGSVAVVLGLRSRSRIKKSGGALAGGGVALAGWIIGLVAAILGALWATFLLGLFMAGVSTAGKGG